MEDCRATGFAGDDEKVARISIRERFPRLSLGDLRREEPAQFSLHRIRFEFD